MPDDPTKRNSPQGESSIVANSKPLHHADNTRQAPSDGKTVDTDDRPSIPKVELPRGGGALRSIDEKFQVNAANGLASFAIPLPFSNARSAFMPNVIFGYSSGSGNGAFGLGWNLSQAFIQRKTDKLLPRYRDAEESDVFLLSGAEDLVPAMVDDGTGHWTLDEFTAPTGEQIKRYRPRIESGFARIEKITPPGAIGKLRPRTIWPPSMGATRQRASSILPNPIAFSAGCPSCLTTTKAIASNTSTCRRTSRMSRIYCTREIGSITSRLAPIHT